MPPKDKQKSAGARSGPRPCSQQLIAKHLAYLPAESKRTEEAGLARAVEVIGRTIEDLLACDQGAECAEIRLGERDDRHRDSGVRAPDGFNLHRPNLRATDLKTTHNQHRIILGP